MNTPSRAVAVVVDYTAYYFKCREVHTRAAYHSSVTRMVRSVLSHSVANIKLAEARPNAHFIAAGQNNLAVMELRAAAAKAEMDTAALEMEAARIAFFDAEHHWTMYRRSFPEGHSFPFPAA
jgi:hypothetical protein